MGTKIDLLSDQLIHHRLEETQHSRCGRDNDNGLHTSCISNEARSVSNESDQSEPGWSSAYSKLGSVGVSKHQQRVP